MNSKQRSRQCGLIIRQQSWELAALEIRSRRAADALTEAESAVEKVEAEISQTDMALCSALNGEDVLDLTSLQAAHQFIAEQQDARKQRLAECQRALQLAQQVDSQVKEVALGIKALERVKASSDCALNRERENRMLERNMETWLQYFGKANNP